MSRPLRIEYPGAWYHILNRGRRREKIYFSDADYRAFLNLLGECTKQFNIEIHSYSLIPNHYHLLAHTPFGNLSRSMRHLNGVYTQLINRKYKTEGSLFKGRFKAILIEKESYLLELVRYIHRNAYKANLETKIGEYQWSSHRGYINERERPKWLKIKEVLLQFSEYEKDARRQLESFVKKEIPVEIEKVLNGIKWPAMLGGERFRDEVRARLQGKKIEKREIPQYKEAIKNISVGDVVKIMEKEIGQEGILSKKKSKAHSVQRRAITYVCREYLYKPCSEIRTALGGISFAAVSNQYALGGEEVREKKGCYEEVKKIMSVLKFNIKT